MRIIYNVEELFKNVNEDKQKIYFKRIKELADALKDITGPIPKKIIDFFKIKKMQGTSSIFKFYLNNKDGARCLFMYEEKDHEVFENENGLILLRAVNHEDQGIIGRRLDGNLKPFEDFLILNDDTQVAHEKLIIDELGKHYLKTIHHDAITLDNFITKMRNNDKRGIFKLSKDQIIALEAPGPLFIRGSAGSGKTLVIISKALKNAHSQITQAYFTYTDMLKDSAKELYLEHENMNGLVGETNFYSIHKYFLDELGLKEFNYFSFARFKTWYENEKFSYRPELSKFDLVQLWTEIRGLLKGYIGKDYYRISTVDGLDKIITSKEIIDLENRGILKRINNSTSRVNIIDSQSLFNQYQGTKLHDYLVSIDINEPVLDRFSYFDNIVERYSPFNRKEKEIIYKFVVSDYQKYLTENNYYDDNDLARLMIDKIKTGTTKKFDHMLIDEVQDLTEMQIISLIRLTNNINNITMAGDNSQVINPTFFEKGRTGLIFRNLFNEKLNNDVTLKENYRNNKNIVEVITKLLDVRQDKIGTYSEDIREVSVNLNKKDGLPIFVDLDDIEIITQLNTWVDVPKVAIITANQEEKQKLINILKVEGETNIYTVHEVKGQEFDKILCYNIESSHQKEWDQIMSGNLEKGSDLVTNYKYYFNLLYVAMTRGVVNLYFYESIKDSLLINEIINLFETIDTNTLEALDVSNYDSSDNRLKQAEKYFNERDYSRAKTMYMRLNNKRMVQLSDSYFELDSGDVEIGLLKLLDFEERMIDAIEYIDKDKYLLLYILYNYQTNKIDIKTVNQLVNNQSLINMTLKYKDKADNYYSLLSLSIKTMTDLKLYRISEVI